MRSGEGGRTRDRVWRVNYVGSLVSPSSMPSDSWISTVLHDRRAGHAHDECGGRLPPFLFVGLSALLPEGGWLQQAGTTDGSMRLTIPRERRLGGSRGIDGGLPA